MSSKKTNRPYTKWNKQGNPFGATRFKILVIMTIGVVGSIALSLFIDKLYQSRLQNRSVSFALSVDASDVARLKNKNLSDEQVPYAQIKRKLAQLKQVYADNKFVYIMDKQGDTVSFLADSEPSDSPSYSPRNQPYDSATPVLKKMFTTGEAAVEGPVKDEYGIWYSSLAPIRDDDGNVIAVMGVDIPAYNYLLATIGIGASIFLTALLWSIVIYFYDRQRNHRFEAFRLQIELLSIASHELRTPLSGIRWGQEVLLQTKLDDTQQSMINAMYDSTLQLQDSIEDILQLAAIDSKKIAKNIRLDVDIAELIDATIKVQTLPAKQKNIDFVYSDTWKPPIVCKGDAVQLRRVFNNIVSNAIKYASSDSHITIGYERKEGNHLVTIRNEGIGVPADELAHIFDGFYRATNAVEKQVNGTGMGLYLSRQTIQQHDGQLWIESVQNEHTTACISLPATTARESFSDPAKAQELVKKSDDEKSSRKITVVSHDE